MKRYIIRSDHHLKLLSMMGQLMERHFSFDYSASSVSLIVDVHDIELDDFEKICEYNRVEFAQMKE